MDKQRTLILSVVLSALLWVGLWLTIAARTQQTPSAGELVIDEIMYDPTTEEPDTEWFEVKNVSNADLDVGGCTISDGEATHTIASNTVIPSGDYFVFGYSSVITGVTVDYPYGSTGKLQLANGGDQITITCNSTVIDAVNYDDSSPWPSDSSGAGKSIAFGVPSGGGTDYAALNDDGNNWGHSTSQIGGGNTDLGTPGARNDDVLGPNAITLRRLTAKPVVPELELVLTALFGMTMLGGALLLIQRRQKQSGL